MHLPRYFRCVGLVHKLAIRNLAVKTSYHAVQHLADHVIAERGVRHGRLVKIPVEVRDEVHRHGETRQRHLHLHVR